MIRRSLSALLLGAILLLPGAVSAEDSAYAGAPAGAPGISRADRVRIAQAGEVTPEKLDRWRRMPPEERERIRERYRKWKSLSPRERERILERRRAWRSLPEGSRRFLRGRREIYHLARPEEKRAIEKFARQMRRLPPDRRRSLRRRIGELRNLPDPERAVRLMDWPFYRRLSSAERRAVNRFLFSEPPGFSPGGSRERPYE